MEILEEDLDAVIVQFTREEFSIIFEDEIEIFYSQK